MKILLPLMLCLAGCSHDLVVLYRSSDATKNARSFELKDGVQLDGVKENEKNKTDPVLPPSK